MEKPKRRWGSMDDSPMTKEEMRKMVKRLNSRTSELDVIDDNEVGACPVSGMNY